MLVESFFRSHMNSPHYQVMCTWGLSGAIRANFSPDIYIWVDALGNSELSSEIATSLPGTSTVLTTTLAEAFAVADWVTQHQLERQQRLSVLVVCADEKTHSIADQLAAGAVIDRLANNGLDAMSPEAAVANAAYTQLKRATTHLIKASEAAKTVAELPTHLSVDETLPTDSVRVLRK
jgi:phosphosulfolactate phosphohydrolase-like enzyme